MNCPVCHSEPEETPIAELHDALYRANEGQLYYYFCHNCEMVFHDEPITEEYYHEQYRTDMQGGTGRPLYKAVDFQKARVESLQPFLKMIVRDFSPKTAVDFGASAGILVKALNDLGIHAQGIDLDAIYAEYAHKEYGYNYVTAESLRGANLDLVTIMHTLEHLLDPVQTLSGLRAAAGDKAVMLCEVPNFATSPLALSYPHRLAFTERSLYNVLASGGWYPIWIIPFWGIHRNYWYPTNLLAMAITLPVSRFEYTMQSARLGQTAARKE